MCDKNNKGFCIEPYQTPPSVLTVQSDHMPHSGTSEFDQAASVIKAVVCGYHSLWDGDYKI